MDHNLTLGSLFDGSGGFPLAGIISGIIPIWASEVEPFPIRVTTKRLPQIWHYGDVSQMDGGRIKPVDIITFGSPCQDMSIAGKREGLEGSRSSLFYEAIRIVEEMRRATHGEYPKYIIWENVTGAFSSNKGEDFRCVLESICQVKDPAAHVPAPAKWEQAGKIVGSDYSVAWRMLDAQYWGVPQRRKRIYLIGDLNGLCAGKILFESESLSGNPYEGFQTRQRASGSPADCSGAAGICLIDQGGERMDITDGIAATLRAESHHPPVTVQSAGFCTEHSANARGIGYEKEKSPTLRAGVVPATVYENHSQDCRYTGPLDKSQTVSATYGTGGNNQPLVVQKPKAYGISSDQSHAMLSDNLHAGIYEAETSRTLDTGCANPGCCQGGIAVVAVEGNGTRPSHKGNGYSEDNVSYTLNATEQHAIAFAKKAATLSANDGPKGPSSQQLKKPEENFAAVYHSSKNSYHTEFKDESAADTLVATDYKDPPTVSEEPEYIVRRLTPTECARLQGFSDWWCSDLAEENPSAEEMDFWRGVFKTYAELNGRKPRTDNQIRKWLANPHTDSAEYKMWGNGIALPCAVFVLSGIVYYHQFHGQ